jgi:hypothetical protein
MFFVTMFVLLAVATSMLVISANRNLTFDRVRMVVIVTVLGYQILGAYGVVPL